MRHVLLDSYSALRLIRTKPTTSQARFRTLIRWTFRRPQVQEEISVRNVSLVEHHIRQAKKSIELWENPSIKDVVPTMQMRTWETKKGGLWTRRPNNLPDIAQ